MALDRRTSGRGGQQPQNGQRPGSSGRNNGSKPPARSDRTPKPAPRRPADEDEDEDDTEAASAGSSGRGARFQKAKQDSKVLMFYGSGALVLLLIILLIAKGGDLFSDNTPPPPPPPVHDVDKLASIKDMRSKAMKKFDLACKLSGADKAKGIREAMDMNADALQKVDEMSNDPRYKGEEYDYAFKGIIDQLQSDRFIMGDEWAKTPH